MSRVLDDPLWTPLGNESATMEALSDAMNCSSGFALLLVRVTSDRHRKRLEQQLLDRVSSRRPESRLLRLEPKPPINDLMELARTAVAAERSDALLISGLEGAFEDL